MDTLERLLTDFLNSPAIRGREDVAFVFLKELWPDIVGVPVAKRTSPWSLKEKRLVVRVADEAWGEGLAEFSQMLRQAINRFWRAPLVDRVDLVVHRRP